MNLIANEITNQVIGAAIELHREVGPLINFNVPSLKGGIIRRV